MGFFASFFQTLSAFCLVIKGSLHQHNQSWKYRLIKEGNIWFMFPRLFTGSKTKDYLRFTKGNKCFSKICDLIIFLQLKQDWNMMAQNLLKSYIFLRDRYTHICSLYSCNINSKCWIDFSGLLWSNKLNQQWLVNRVRISRATLPNLFHKTLLASLTLHWIEGLRRVKPSFQLQQRDFTSTFARRIWKWIPLQWYRLHL